MSASMLRFAALIALPLLSGPVLAAESAKPLDASDPRMHTGSAIYTDTCRACHGPTGAGVPGLAPKLAGSEIVQGDAAGPIVMVLQGGKIAATPKDPTGAAMPSLGWRLSDRQLADVVTYIRNVWGNAAAPVSAGDVAALRNTK